MSYASFLVLFIGLPLSVLIVFFKNVKHDRKSLNLKGILVLCTLAFLYTTPWDNYLVANKVWWYGKDRVIGVIGFVPYEEYAFFILQTVMTGLWCFFLQTKIKLQNPEKSYLNIKKPIAGSLFLIILLSIFGLKTDQYFYLSLILVWATPILLIQFLFGAKYLFMNMRIFILSFLPPTLYLWAADFYAIKEGIWSISTTYTTGINLGVLPVEEMVFFLVTNLMVAQGLLLFNLMRSDVEVFVRKLKNSRGSKNYA